jgi:hypothetical protein
MSTKKIVIAIVAIAAVTLAAVGIAAGQIAQNQTYTQTQTNPNAPNQGVWGWIGNCFGYWVNEAPNGQYTAPPATPNEPTGPEVTPYQGYYGYGYGYGYGPCGPCWAR